MNPTIQVTINPDGVSCTEVRNFTALRKPERPGDRIRELNDLMNIKPLRTFDIASPIPIETTDKGIEFKNKPGTTHTAEILETYTEPVNGIAGKIKILS